MDSMPNKSVSPESLMDANVNSQSSFDLVRVLWRWKWLPILGAIIGAGVGYMYFTKLPQQYRSEALIQVVSPIPVITRSELFDGSKVGNWGSSSDESRAIKSRTVLGLAVKAGNLEKQQQFLGMTAEQIVYKLSGAGGVDVQPADKSANATQQLIIGYTCNNADLAQAVVNAVVEGYQTFLAQEYETVDTEVLNYFTNQQKTLDERYGVLQSKLEDLKRDFPNVLWKVDEPIDPYSSSYVSRLGEADSLKNQAVRLKAELLQVQDARKKGRNPEDLLMMLHSGPDVLRQMLGENNVTTEKELESERLKRAELLPLTTQEQQLQRTEGPNHPTVKQLQARISVVKELIKAAEESEAKTKERELALKAETAQAQQARGAEYILQVTMNSLAERYQSIVKHEEELRKLAAEDLKKSQEFQQVIQHYQLIAEQMGSVKEMLKGFTAKLDTVPLASKNMNQRSLKELNPASPGYGYGPFSSKYLLGGAAIGVLIMSCLAVLMDLADRSYRSPEEIVNDLGLPVLGHIPAMDPKKLKRSIENIDSTVVTLHHGRGRVAESFRAVRTALFFSNRGADLKVVQVTSPVPGDGKSTLSANLAVALAQSGRRVLLIDADFRRPRIEKIFGLERDVGMVQVVAGKAELEDALYKSPVPNLTILPGGKKPSNPAELLSSARFAHLVDVLREKFDLIIIDTPPVLAVSDPSVVASVVDGVVVTMRLRRNIKPLATRTLNTLEAVDAPLLGIVVNGVSAEAAYGGYGYNYGYNDYRYSYRYSENNYAYGKYREYSAGYVEEDVQEQQSNESDNANSST